MATRRVPSWLIKRERALSGPGESSQPPAKDPRRAREELEQAIEAKDMANIVEILLKMSCQHAELLRELSGCLWKCAVGSVDDPLLANVKDSMRAYNELEQKPGLPHIQAFANAIDFMLDSPKVTALNKRYLATLWEQHILDKEPEDITEVVVFFRLRKAYSEKGKPEMKKLLWAMGDHMIKAGPQEMAEVTIEPPAIKLSKLFSNCLRDLGHEVKIGTPPKTHLERLAQRLLDKHFKKSKD
eukprot:TRINITY_DN23889_c0_g1_i1.p2 TRINITY_DN23889_c0_g1~~TRINITY_DN23889_c0_g1_i1.p2  ORF type:complete len:278 (-),score=44.77 TRINITY_DN23889_c0_g1_i1:372-1097(-)